MELNKKKFNEVMVIIICVAIFLVLFVTNARVAGLAMSGKIPKEAVSGINGIMSQIKVLICVALVVMARKKRGFTAAVVLCCIDAVYILMFGVIKSHNIGSLPGVVTPFITVVVCYLIKVFAEHADKAQEKLEEMNRSLIAENDEITKEGEKLSHVVYYDALTGLCNKRMFFKELDAAINSEDKSPFSVVFLNIDDFSDFNQKYDDKMGDIVLSTFGYRFHNFCGDTAVVGRIEGDQFAVLLKGPKTRESINSYISDLRSEICDTISVKDKRVDLTMTVGISVYPRDGRNSKEMMDHAEAALQKAKKAEKGTIEFYS